MNQNPSRKAADKMYRSFRVSDLPAEERPRERLLRLGPDVLSSQELLAIIISSGVAGMSAAHLAQILISKFGSLARIAEVSAEEIRRYVKGVGPAKIARLKACFEIARRIENEKKRNFFTEKDKKIITPDFAYAMVKSRLLDYKREHFFVVSLDSRNRITGIDEVSIGTLEASLVHPREAFNAAIMRNAAKIIIAHNHPSDDPEPSQDDISTTKRLKEAGSIIGIELIDHIIVCKSSFFSFKEKGIID
ncbi:MAG: DNA repair protein RadC [Candidatus Omnitrophica bacterium]|nr:DNA repair protein RadC [Candidatus Omnitrophota bacterium]